MDLSNVESVKNLFDGTIDAVIDLSTAVVNAVSGEQRRKIKMVTRRFVLALTSRRKTRSPSLSASLQRLTESARLFAAAILNCLC